MPKEYTAVTMVSDEYKEVDLAIGLNSYSARIREAMGGANTGMNDMAIYCKVLKTKDFARSISHKRIPDKGITYGEWIDKEDTIEAIQDRIAYNFSGKKSTLTISFTDRDALVASQMLDSVTTQLQSIVTEYRHSMANAKLKNAEKELNTASQQYRLAQEAYVAFADSHLDASTIEAKQREKTLEREMSDAYKYYEKATNEYARQLALKQRAYVSFAVIQTNTVPVKSNGHFIGNLLAFLFIALVLAKGYILFQKKRKKSFKLDFGDFFSPWNLTIFIWAADIFLYFLQGTLYPIGPKFLSCFLLWLATFLPVSLAAYWLSGNNTTQRPDFKKPIEVNMWIFHFLFAISIIMTIAYARTIWAVVSQFDTENLLYNIRLLAVHETLTSGILNYTQSINYALFFVAIWLYPRISKIQLGIIVMLNLIIELAMMEKSGILVMILGTLFVLYEREVIQKRTIAITLASTVLFFFFFNMAKEESTTDDSESMTFLEFFGMYITSPLIAFEQLEMTISDGFGSNTFNAVYPYLNRLGFDFKSIERLQEFVLVPVPTNVYTIMQPFYNDFGRTGVAFFGFAYGAIFGYAYRMFREGNALFRCLYTFLVEVIIIQFYNENFLQSFFLVAGFTFFILLMTQDFVRLSYPHDKRLPA